MLQIKNPHIHKLLNLFDKLKNQAYNNEVNNKCFIADCTNRSIRSHSLSESKVLQVLSSNEEKIVQIGDYLNSDFTYLKFSAYQQTNYVLKDISLSKASTFYGFCNKCDCSLFYPIDNLNYTDAKKINFLHFLRAIAYQMQFEKRIINAVKKFLDKKNLIENHFITTLLSSFYDLINKLPQDSKIEYDFVSSVFQPFTISKSFVEVDTIAYVLGIHLESVKVKSLKIFDKTAYPMDLNDFLVDFKACMLYCSSTIEAIKNVDLENDVKLYLENAINHYNEANEQITNLIKAKNYEDFSSVTFYLEGVYEITGNFIYDSDVCEEVALTFFPEKETERTIFIFSVWKPSDAHKLYFEKINNMSITDFKHFVSEIILRKANNTYLSKGFLNSFNKDEQQLIAQVKILKNCTSFNLFK